MARNRTKRKFRREIFALDALERRVLLAANIYVSPSGSDSSGTGAIGSPFATLQHAVNLAVAGTTVLAEAGTYAGFVCGLGPGPALNGTSTSLITIEADPNAAAGSVIIDSANASTADCIRLEGCTYMVINGFTMTNNGTVTSAGIHANDSDHITASNNDITGMGTWGIFTGFDNYFSALDNICDNSISQHGIYVSNTCTGAIVMGNTCAGNAGCGIHFNGDVSEGGVGLATDALIADNIIYNNGALGGSGLDCDGLQDSVIENNLFYDNHASGLFLYTGDASAGSIDDVVVNNTFVMAADGRYAVNINESSTGCTVFNNIIFDASASNGDINVDATSLSGFTSDYNVLTGLFTDDGTSTNLTLAQWQAATGQDTHSVISTAAAVFANVAGNNYQLAVSSPAIAAGIGSFNGSGAPATDILGVARPTNGQFDAGAYQHPASVGSSGPDTVTISSGGVVTVIGTTSSDTIAGGVNPSDSSQFYFLIQSAGQATVDQVYPISQVTGVQINCDPVGSSPVGADADWVNLGGDNFGFAVSVTGGGGSDTVDGQLGSNDITTGAGSSHNLIYGSIGADSLQSEGRSDTIRSGGGADTIRADNGNNILVGGKDGSQMYAGLGADTLRSGAGNSTLHGGAGGTLMLGGFGSDLIMGGSGNDTMIGGSGNEHLIAGTGDDFMDAGWDAYLVLAGGTVLPTPSGSDIVNGATGVSDTLAANTGSPVMTGGSGNNVYDVNTAATLQNVKAGEFVAKNDTIASATQTTTIHLTIQDLNNGVIRDVVIPQGAGSAPSGTSTARTTDANGTVVFQSASARTFTLGDFFNHWGVDFNSVGIGQFIASLGSGHAIGMTVNGAANFQFNNYAVQNGDNIVITFTQ